MTVAHELVIQYILNILEAVASQTKTILVADEVWVALAMLHRNQPERASFYASEIVDQIRAEKAAGSFRPGIHPHIYLHCVANLAPNAARYRMLFKLDDDTYRLYRTGDYAHPERRGKTAPKRNDLPTRYHHLLDWYETNYCRREAIAADQDDPILQLWGLGKHIWADATADDYVASLRAGWNAPPAPAEPPSPAKPLPDEDAIWQRIADHQGETFYTKKRLPFTYRLEGASGIWFFRSGKRINKRLHRGDVAKALCKCPPEGPSEIGECFDPSYLYGVLTDPRIRGADW